MAPIERPLVTAAAGIAAGTALFVCASLCPSPRGATERRLRPRPARQPRARIRPARAGAAHRRHPWLPLCKRGASHRRRCAHGAGFGLSSVLRARSRRRQQCPRLFLSERWMATAAVARETRRARAAPSPACPRGRVSRALRSAAPTRRRPARPAHAACGARPRTRVCQGVPYSPCAPCRPAPARQRARSEKERPRRIAPRAEIC